MQDFRFDNPFVAPDFRNRHVRLCAVPTPVQPPEGVVERIADANVLGEYRRGKDMACADIVICTRTPEGKGAVLLSLRKPTEPFGNKWWIHGGSVGAYQDLLEFISARAQKECGIPVKPQVWLGVYRTCAADRPQSTMQTCFATVVPYEALAAKMTTDKSHASVRLFTHGELEQIPANQKHWYPMHVARFALNNIPPS